MPSLRCVYHASVYNNSVPATWKSANVSCLHKKDDETDKSNYRPISLLCVPGKLMESCVVSTITSHIADHGLSNKHQWAYKQGHSTELLLAKMSEDWRRALDNNHTVGIVFVDFRKAFDSISHPLLLKKLQGLGIAGDLWSWISSYLSERSQITIVNGEKSSPRSVKFGVPQRSVLGPTLFSLYCNDLPDIINDNDGVIHMYADDTTMYVVATSPDLVIMVLNKILALLFEWCCRSLLTPHLGKTEFMLLSRSRFVGPLPGLKFGNCYIEQVTSSMMFRC